MRHWVRQVNKYHCIWRKNGFERFCGGSPQAIVISGENDFVLVNVVYSQLLPSVLVCRPAAAAAQFFVELWIFLAYAALLQCDCVDWVDHMPASLLFRPPLALRTLKTYLSKQPYRRHSKTFRHSAADSGGGSLHSSAHIATHDLSCRATQSAADIATKPALSPASSKTQVPATARRCVMLTVTSASGSSACRRELSLLKLLSPCLVRLESSAKRDLVAAENECFLGCNQQEHSI